MTSITQTLPLATLSHDEWLEPLMLERWCEDCGRSGVVSNPLWEQFHEEFKGAPFVNAATMTDAEYQWWHDHGYPESVWRWTPIPPEELTCVECEGRGRLLTNEGRTLLAFVQRWAQE